MMGMDQQEESEQCTRPTSGARQTPTDLKGCALAIAYESDPSKIQPEDFTVISVNHECVWKKNIDFQIPNNLPPCPEGGCHCLWEWTHAIDAGSQQLFHLAYRCKVDGRDGNDTAAET